MVGSFVDEYRFILELMMAVLPMPFIACEKKKNFWIRFPVAVAVIAAVATIKPFVAQYWLALPVAAMNTLFIAWYVFITLLVFACVLITFEISLNDAILFLVAGYAVQHVCYVIVCELLTYFSPILQQSVAVYVAVNIGVSVVLCTLYSFVFSKCRKSNGKIMDDSPLATVLLTLFLAFLIGSAFAFQYFFNVKNDLYIKLLSTISDIIASVLISLVTLFVVYSCSQRYETELLEMRRENDLENYRFFLDTVDYLNVKFHDMKHQLNALYERNEIDAQEYDDITDTINAYGTLINTGNAEIDFILSDKSLKCHAQGIHFSAIVDGSLFDGYDVNELYAFFCNIIDNAVEYVSKLEGEKRYISFVCKKSESFILVKESNYLLECPELDSEGFPVTTKKESRLHGYGLRSVARFAKKHGGSMRIRAENETFELLVMLPITKSSHADKTAPMSNKS